MSKLDLAELFDEADAMAAEDRPRPPDLPLPSNYDEVTPHRLMEVRNAGPPLPPPITASAVSGSSSICRKKSKSKGRGWYARHRIEAGTVLLVEKPTGMVMRWEEDEAEYGDEDEEEEEEDMSVEGGFEQQQQQQKQGAAAASEDIMGSGSDDNEDGDGDGEDEDGGPTGSVGTALLTMRLAESIKLDPTLWTGATTSGSANNIDDDAMMKSDAAADSTNTTSPTKSSSNAAGVGICHLYPQTELEIRSLPPWVCSHPPIGLAMEHTLSTLCGENAAIDADTAAAIRLRLPLIVRYNALSVETGPELFVHPSPVGHSSLSGTALFQYASLFNHSHRPTVNRWAVGDVTFFVANATVEAGEELTISYVEHEVLCEDSGRRTAVLGMDFVDDDDDDDDDDDGGGEEEEADVVEGMGEARSGDGGAADDNVGNDDDGNAPMMPVVDAEVQQELMEMVPEERLEAIDELLAQAEGKRKAPEDQDEVMGGHGDDNDHDDDDDHDDDAAGWFQCDAHQLRILQALTLDGLGRHGEAYPVWERCVAFVDARLPPLDETGVALRVQAALCAWARGTDDADGRVARSHAQRAMKDHDALFGGGPERFRRRYRRELELNLRPECKKNKKRPVRGLKVMRKLFPIENR